MLALFLVLAESFTCLMILCIGLTSCMGIVQFVSPYEALYLKPNICSVVYLFNNKPTTMFVFVVGFVQRHLFLDQCEQLQTFASYVLGHGYYVLILKKLQKLHIYEFKNVWLFCLKYIFLFSIFEDHFCHHLKINYTNSFDISNSLTLFLF